MSPDQYNLEGPTADEDDLEPITWWMNATLRFAVTAALCYAIAYSAPAAPWLRAFTAAAAPWLVVDTVFVAVLTVLAFRRIDREVHSRASRVRR